MRRLRTALLILASTAAIVVGCAKRPNDAQLTTNIKAQLFSDPQTKNTNLQIAVKNGVATISGTVPNNGARYEAYKIAASTPGVSKVDDQMTIQTPEQTAETTPPRAPYNGKLSKTPILGEPIGDRRALPPGSAPPPPAAKAKKVAEHKKHARKERRVETAHEKKSKAAVPASVPAAETAANAPATAPVSAPIAQTPAPVKTPPPPAPPQPITAQFSVGTAIEIRTIDAIDAGKNSPGDEFQASLAKPLTSNGKIVVPAGANVYLRMVTASNAGQFKGRSVVQLQLVRLEFQGTDYPLVSDTYTDEGDSRGKSTAEKVGGGAILGALIGAIAGGGKGAAIGGAVGAGGGGVVQGASKAKQVHISPETKIDFALQQPLEITYLPGGTQ